MAGISKAERERREAEAAAAASAQQGGDVTADQPQDAGPALVRMTRDASAYPAPHAADVHPAEVENFAAGGWQVASD